MSRKNSKSRGVSPGRALGLVILAAAGCAGWESPAWRTAAPADPRSPAAAPVPEFPPPAPEALAEEGPLTLERCLAIALAENPSRRSSLDEVAAREAGVGEASSAFFPEVAGQAGYSRWRRPAVFFRPETSIPIQLGDKIGPLNDYTAGLRARTVLFAGGARLAERRAALALREASREDAEQVRQDLSLEVRRAFHALLAAEEMEKVAIANRTRSDSNLRVAEDRLEAGAAPRADVLKAKVDRSDADLTLVSARNLVRVGRGQLNASMGRPVDSPTRIADGVEAPVPPGSFDLGLALEDAVRSRPAVRAALDRTDALKESVRKARASFWPTISAQGSYGVRDIDFPPAEEDWMVGVDLELQLFSGFSRTSRLDRTRAELAKADAQARGLVLRVQEEVWTAHSKLQETYEALQAAETLVRDADESQRVARERYGQGAGTMLDLLDAEVAFSRAQARRVEARFDHQTAVAEFKRAAGRLE